MSDEEFGGGQCLDITGEELQEAWKKEPEETRGAAWSLHNITKVWIHNDSGHKIIVCVHQLPIRRIMEVSAKANASATGAGVEGALKYAVGEGLMQYQAMEAGAQDLAFELGVGGNDALVTAVLADNWELVLCKNRRVKCGKKLPVGSPPMPDKVFSAPAFSTS